MWLACHKVDFRKGHNGLLAECYKMGLDPFRGDVVIFLGRNKKRLKVLYADSTGLWVSSKLLMKSMKTRLRFLVDPSCKEITESELGILIEGSSYKIEKEQNFYNKPINQTGLRTQVLLSA